MAAAVRKDLIAKSPFADCKAGHQSNPARPHFITQADAAALLASCPDAEWRLIVALCRYGGLRCPSELLTLTWPDVDWERGRFRVHAPKAEHHKDGGERWVPIFPELRRYLEDAFELAEPGCMYVITRYRDSNQNLRTQLGRIIRRAGLTPWPRPFHNLRASRQTELVERFPVHCVCAWLGNTAAVAAEHYLQGTEAHYRQAAQIPAQSATDGACQRETGFPAESRNVVPVNHLDLKSIPVSTYDYPQGDSNPCLSRERAMS